LIDEGEENFQKKEKKNLKKRKIIFVDEKSQL